MKLAKEKYKNLSENAKDIIVILDKKGTITDINPAVKGLTGFSPQKIKGHHFKKLKFIGLESRRRIAKYFRKTLKGIKSAPYEIKGVDKDGNKLVVEINASPFIKNGEVIGSLAILRDITKRKQVEEQLQESEEKFRTFMETATDLMHIADKNGNFTYVNEVMARTLGYSKEEMIGMHVTQVLNKEEVRKNFKPKLKELITTGKINLKSIWERKDGKQIYCETRVVAVYDADGKYIGSRGVCRDVSERKVMEKALYESREKLQSIIEFSPAAITVTDLSGKITKCNQATLNMHGFSTKEELIGKKAFDLIARRDWQRASKNMEKTLKQGFMNDIEYTFLTKEGREFPAELSASVIRDSSGNPMGFMAITKNISERKQIDRAKSEFISLASHQLRTPLSIMNWYSEMLLEGKAGKINNQQKEYLEEVYLANQHLVKLTNLLLNVSRIELGTFSINPKLINLTKISDDALNEFSPIIKKKKLKIVRNYDKNLPNINADPNIIYIVFQNLLSNAIKYTSKRRMVKLSIKKQKANVLIKISDNGYGIPKSQQPKIFTKFFRADNITEKEPDGAGLGLYIVKSILEQVGAKIWFKSEKNKGTIFYVLIHLKGMKKVKKGELNI